MTPHGCTFPSSRQPPIRIAAGTLIDYRLRVHGLPLRWQSRISVWEPPLRFVDEQTRGPYRRWHHEHVFETADGGTLCHDIVDYAVYGGSLINALFVRPDLFKIFAFRQSKLRELFPDTGTSTLRAHRGDESRENGQYSAKSLLTGASGYVGGRLLPCLSERSIPVRCLTRRPEFLAARVADGVEVVRGDVLDRESLSAAMAGVEIGVLLCSFDGIGRRF